uniref:Nucleotide-diphospho-sugar transferase domain-containing protein n=1 Tax=viral metagenome TaxID=1070528 RepID=A0A6C0F5V8_9ZZZZ|tara:strand:- start:23882 stop:24679 length:798 start_codon:yes stop_codon:yes gene_type:complete
MPSVAFAIPIYGEHLSYGATLLQTRKDTNNEHIPLIFACSTKSESQVLTLLSISHNYQKVKFYIIPCDNIHHKAIYKKYTLLNILKDTYDYIACFDCETVFIKHIPSDVLIKEGDFPNILGSFLDPPSQINETCAKLLNIDNQIEEWVDIYFWFSNLPVYKSTHLTAFFNYFNDITFLASNYNHFEYILYIYFVKSQKLSDINIVDIGDTYGIYTGWSLECCKEHIIDNLYAKNCPMPLWCWPTTYQKITSSIKNTFYVLYHVDR